MTPYEAEDFLIHWDIGTEKGFKYYDYGLFDVEYVVIRKDSDNMYVIISDRSTCKDGPFNKEKIEKLLGANKLIPFGQNNGWGLDFKNTKSGGCQCGAWATQNPTCHARWCPMSRS